MSNITLTNAGGWVCKKDWHSVIIWYSRRVSVVPSVTMLTIASWNLRASASAAVCTGDDPVKTSTCNWMCDFWSNCVLHRGQIERIKLKQLQKQGIQYLYLRYHRQFNGDNTHLMQKIWPQGMAHGALRSRPNGSRQISQTEPEAIMSIVYRFEALSSGQCRVETAQTGHRQ